MNFICAVLVSGLGKDALKRGILVLDGIHGTSRSCPIEGSLALRFSGTTINQKSNLMYNQDPCVGILKFFIMENRMSFISKFSKVEKDTNLVEIIELIRGDEISERIMNARKALEEGNKDGYDRIKKSLPAVTFAGTFRETRKNENLDSYSGLVILDVDHVAENINTLKTSIASEGYTRLCFISPGGQGLKILVKVSSEAIDHTTAFQQVADYYQEKYGIDVDQSGKDIARLCFLSHDPDLVFHEDSNIFKVIALNGEISDQETFIHLYKRAVELTGSKHRFEEGSRNEFVFSLAGYCNRCIAFLWFFLQEVKNEKT